jgi:hypothetical protein
VFVPTARESSRAVPVTPLDDDALDDLGPGVSLASVAAWLGEVVVLSAGAIAFCSWLGWSTPDDTPPAAPPSQSAAAPAAPTPVAARPPAPALDLPQVGPSIHEPLPRPDVLVGAWESRSDDSSQSGFAFHADGAALVLPAATFGPDGRPKPARLVAARWFLAERHGAEYVVEVGPDFGVPNNVRFTLLVTSRNAFTLLSVAHRGEVVPEGLRFVRRVVPAAPSP